MFKKIENYIGSKKYMIMYALFVLSNLVWVGGLGVVLHLSPWFVIVLVALGALIETLYFEHKVLKNQVTVNQSCDSAGQLTVVLSLILTALTAMVTNDFVAGLIVLMMSAFIDYLLIKAREVVWLSRSNTIPTS